MIKRRCRFLCAYKHFATLSPGVKTHVKAFYGRRYRRSRGGKQQTMLSRPKAEPGRAILQRVLQEGVFLLRGCGAGKQREEVLDDTDTTW